ncbi:unnamed protein product [Timema podura]|uniref:Uncharacterized protein n=1 Tax=Timema podura TaxID=61482 RepID=A0ABN7NJ80_TIMPD|nr:unnamed protein product [Timema podura]
MSDHLLKVDVKTTKKVLTIITSNPTMERLKPLHPTKLSQKAFTYYLFPNLNQTRNTLALIQGECLVQETENYVRLAVLMAVVMSKPKDSTLEEYVTYLKNKLESYASPSVCEASDTQHDFEQTVLSIQQEDLISKIRNIVINPQSPTHSGEGAGNRFKHQ